MFDYAISEAILYWLISFGHWLGLNCFEFLNLQPNNLKKVILKRIWN